ncbi:hypothetical protein PLESTB_000131400 [Pleodorina starrii]|uniref:Uncharacterized protein n=1 Tax=Pleodorina starrii TaxID=330485 RepID=A0A9W6BAW8_9CHLO|nr:hypothetical protein PLESTB_000131400 [Pleodorina starrii]
MQLTVAGRDLGSQPPGGPDPAAKRRAKPDGRGGNRRMNTPPPRPTATSTQDPSARSPLAPPPSPKLSATSSSTAPHGCTYGARVLASILRLMK